MFDFCNDMFLCYRNVSKDIQDELFNFKAACCEAIAKRCKDIFERINKGKDENEKLKIYFSQDSVMDNYLVQQSINTNVGKARFFVIFVFSGFTQGFLNEDGTVNENCSTAKEFVRAEEARQDNGLIIVTVNINNETFSKNDENNIEKLFKSKNIYKTNQDGDNSVIHMTKNCQYSFEIPVALKDSKYANNKFKYLYNEIVTKKKNRMSRY